MRLFHGTGAEVPVGATLGGAREQNYQSEVYTGAGVYLTTDPGEAYFYAVFGSFSAARFFDEPHVYEVDVDPRTLRQSNSAHWIAPEATVSRDITGEAVAAFRKEWETTWKPIIIMGAAPGGMPTREMIVAEFESRMKKHATKESAMTSPVRFGIVDGTDPEKALKQLLTLDSDGDGVPNVKDKAPFDPKVSEVKSAFERAPFHPRVVESMASRAPGDPGVREQYGLDKQAVEQFVDLGAREGATFNRTPNRGTKPVNDWDQKVMHSVTKDGGFTFRDVVGDGPSEGYMVSVAKHNEVKVPLRDLTSAHVSDYMSTHQQELKDPNNYLGGWVYKGNVYLDISRHTTDRNEAMRLARANQQLGVYDIGKGETLMTEQEQQQKASAAVCSGCGESYDPAQVEGSLHDHWTAAEEKTASAEPGGKVLRFPVEQRVTFVAARPTNESGVEDFVNALRAEGGLEPLEEQE